MEAESRLLEEWKANNDLLKFYEDLKQKRSAHFLTIQTAFLAFFALIAKDALGADALAAVSFVSLTALVLIAIPPLIISFYFMRVLISKKPQLPGSCAPGEADSPLRRPGAGR